MTYQKLSEISPPKAGPYLVRGIERTSSNEWYRVLDWDFKPKYNGRVPGFSAGGMTLNAAAEITHWAEVPAVNLTGCDRC